MERKTFTTTPELKQDGEDAGLVIARFATLNTIDSDGDVTLPDAFGEQVVRMQPYGHQTFHLPIGKGTIHEEGDDAIAELRLNLAIASDHYSALKFDFDHGPPQIEWSYVFDIIEQETGEHEGQDVRFLKKLKVHSVDPVFLGAGVNTGTVSVKAATETHACEGCGLPLQADGLKACANCDPAGAVAWLKEQGVDLGLSAKLAFTGAHRTRAADEETSWSAPSLSDFTEDTWNDLSAEQRRRIAGHYVGSRAEMPPDTFSELFGPHHQPVKSGGVGPVVWRAISSGRMFQLSNTITENPSFRRHIGGHYRQFGKTPPWEESESRGLPFDERFEEAEHALCDVTGFIARSGELVASLREQGEMLTDRKRAYLGSLCAGLAEAHETLTALLKEPERDSPAPRASWRFRLAELEQMRREVALTG